MGKLLKSKVKTPNEVVWASDLLQSRLKPLSEEETKELDSLKEDNLRDSRIEKLKVFKNLPSHIRQHVIDSHAWKNAVETINEVKVQESARQLELTSRYEYGKIFAGDLSHWGSQYVSIPAILPKGLSIQDLIEAHTQASIEEEVLNGK